MTGAKIGVMIAVTGVMTAVTVGMTAATGVPDRDCCGASARTRSN
jgi:hypothetical protein